MSRAKQEPPASVPAKATQAGEVRARWAWTEASVWTDRMLATLEKGLKGGKWFSLIDKVYAMTNLHAAFARVARNDGAAGVDHVSIRQFEDHLEDELSKLSQQLRDQTYQPQAVRRTWIPKPGSHEKRPLGIPTVRDRVVQAALRNVLEPIFERDFAQHSYGFRPGRGCKDALRRVDQLLKEGHTHVVDADLKSYFDTIPHETMMQCIKAKVSDSRVLSLIELFLKQGVLEGMSLWTPESGTPQGAVISPLLANIYLDALDHLMAKRGFEMVRYADDFVVLCRNGEEAEAALALVREWVKDAGLTLHPEKTRLTTEAAGFEFLGYRFAAGKRWPRDKSLAKFKDSIRQKTRRTSGQSLQVIIADMNRTLRGWFEYYKHSHKWTFERLDQWLRKRVRSILRKRRGGRGPGRGRDHQRWPNAFFTEQGLLSLQAAHASGCRSSRR